METFFMLHSNVHFKNLYSSIEPIKIQLSFTGNIFTKTLRMVKGSAQNQKLRFHIKSKFEVMKQFLKQIIQLRIINGLLIYLGDDIQCVISASLIRTVVCQELAKVIEYAAWFRLLSFPHIVLNTITKNNFKDSRRPNIIRHNLEVFSKLNDVPSLFNELLNLLSIDRPKKPESHSDKLLIKIAQRKIGEGDIGGAVRVLCSQEGIAEYNAETIEKLKAKHPAEESMIEEDKIPHLERFETSTEQIVNAIRHFPISSSAGIDGLRPRHLKDLISFSCGDAAAKLTSATAKLVNVIRDGKICPKLLPVFYGAALIALAKKNGDIRPIAIGLNWPARLLAQRLAPIQNGFGIKGGAEAIVHAVRAFVEANHPNPMAVIKFDYRNAFNELFRKFLLGEVKKTAPSLFPMMQQAYRCPSDLYYGDIIIKSQRGTQHRAEPTNSVTVINFKRMVLG